jgi:hypothetical protein
MKFKMKHLGPQHLLNRPKLILFKQMREEQKKLIKELHELMLADKDIYNGYP